MALELAVLTPLVIAMLLLVVALGRVQQGHQLVDQAAAAAARAGSLASTPGGARSSAKAAALDTLAAAGISCRGPVVDVDTTAFRAGGQVTATVHCTADLSAMALLGVPGSIALTSTAASPLEARRDVTSTAGTP